MTIYLPPNHMDNVATLTDDEFRCDIEGMQAASKLGGRIPKAALVEWTRCPEAAPSLVAKGFWTDQGDHYCIPLHREVIL